MVSPNRLAVYLTSLAGLAAAVAVPLADMDASSTAGVIAGLAAIATVVSVWLKGWMEHEKRQAGDTAIIPGDVGDEAANVGPDGTPLV